MNVLQQAAIADPYATWKFWLDVADKGIKALALCVGAIWTVVNYRRGRTFSKRLEPSVSGHLGETDSRQFLFLTCSLKNLGLSKVEIQQRGSACLVFAITPQDLNPPPDGRPQDIFSMFQEHGWIEPGEQISHQQIISIGSFPTPLIGVKVRMRLVSAGLEWNASCILDLAPPASSIQGQEKGYRKAGPVRPA